MPPLPPYDAATRYRHKPYGGYAPFGGRVVTFCSSAASIFYPIHFSVGLYVRLARSVHA